MWFIGDVHGKVIEFQNMLERRILPDSEEGEPIIQVGDMGAGFVTVPRYHPNVRWIRGNHDDPQESRKHPNYIGLKDYGYNEQHKLFWLAGAWSIDKDIRLWRMRNGGAVQWWPDEELSQPELDEALALYIEKKPEIVVSHEAPASIVPRVLWVDTSYMAPASFKSGDPMYDPLIAVRRVETGYYARKEKLGCVDTITSRMLQRMYEHHTPKHWVFGHYHIPKIVDAGSTLFKCVGELEVYRVMV